MASKKATLTLKFGDKEIRYEAEREAVEAQLQHIVGQILQVTPMDGPVELTRDEESVLSSPAVSAAPAAKPKGASEAQRLQQLYKISDDGYLTLRKLPDRTADTLLLVIYGMLKLQDRSWVHAPGMTRAARDSGARFDRADRLLAGYQDLIEGVGNRRAKRYRLTAAGHEYCSSLMERLVGPIDNSDVITDLTSKTDNSASETVIPKKVTALWDGELLTSLQVAQRLGIDEAEVGKLRHAWKLLGIPGGNRKRRRYFYPAFQIDDERRQIYPQARTASQIVSRKYTSRGIAKWWNTVEPQLGRKPMELIGTPEADAVVQVAKATFGRTE